MKEKKKKSAEKETCFCPYCEEELVAAKLPFCKVCGVTFYQCPTCHITVLDRKATKCPKCGVPLK
jgi:hypothetical protein